MAENLKNPFGIRDGKTILVRDLGENEHGLKCNCVCPNCGCRYVARFGTINRPHFAHEKNAVCDEVLAVMTGLYNFITEAVSNGGTFRVPGYFGEVPKFNPYISYTKDNYRHSVHFIHRDFGYQLSTGYACVIRPTEITVSSVEVQYDAKNYPAAALLHYESKGNPGVLAVVILPPATVCKDVKPKPFQDYPTIALDVEMLEDMDSKKLREIICTGTEEKQWLSSQRIDAWVEKEFNQYQQKLAEWKERDAQSRRETSSIDVSTIHPQAVRWNGIVYYPGTLIQHPAYGMGTIQRIEVHKSVSIGSYHAITAEFEGEPRTFCLEISIK